MGSHPNFYRTALSFCDYMISFPHKFSEQVFRPNQWTGFYMIGTSVRKELTAFTDYFRKKLEGPKHAYESHSLVPLVYVNNGHTCANGNAL